MKIEIHVSGQNCLATVMGFVSGPCKVGEIAAFIVPDEYVDAMTKDLRLVLYDNTYGILTFDASFVESKPEKEGEVRYLYRLTKLIDTVQRRNEVKVKTSFRIQLQLVDQQKVIQARVMDLSVGGMFIETDETLSLQERFSFMFTEGTKPIILRGKIIREQPANDKQGYGCQFDKMTLGDESILRGYVFQRQLIRGRNKR